MSILSKLAGEPAMKKIGDVDINIQPLGMKHVDLFLILEDGTSEQKAQAVIKIIRETLKKSVPDATDDEIDNISNIHFYPLLVAIQEVNGSAGEIDASVIAKIKELQERAR